MYYLYYYLLFIHLSFITSFARVAAIWKRAANFPSAKKFIHVINPKNKYTQISYFLQSKNVMHFYFINPSLLLAFISYISPSAQQRSYKQHITLPTFLLEALYTLVVDTNRSLSSIPSPLLLHPSYILHIIYFPIFLIELTSFIFINCLWCSSN